MAHFHEHIHIYGMCFHRHQRPNSKYLYFFFIFFFVSKLCLLTLKVKVTQLRLTLCTPMDYSTPSSSVHGVLQARILEWVATLFSRGSSWPRDRTQVTHITSRFFTVWATQGTLITGRFYYTNSWISSQTWRAGPGIPLLKCCLRDCFTGSLRLLGYDIGQFSNLFDSWTLFSVKVN